MPESAGPRRAPPKLPEQPNLEVLPPRVWGVLIGLGFAATASLFGLIGILTGWELFPSLPYLYNGLVALSLVLACLMLPVAWRQLPENTKSRLYSVGRARQTPAEMDPPPWCLPAAEVCKVLHVPRQQGLPSTVVKQRLKRHGHNDLELPALAPFPFFFVDKLYTPTRVLLLLVVVLYAGLVGLNEALVAGAALVLLILMDVWAEWKATRAFVIMRRGVPRQALVLRDNAAHHVDRRELVPGDIVLLHAGMEVPADLRLLHTSLLEIDESRLSGEWDSVACGKDATAVGLPAGSPAAAAVPGQAAVAVSCLDLPTIALAGSIVVSGRGSGVVFRTGKQTELGRKNVAAAAARSSGGGSSSRRASKGQGFSSLGGSFDPYTRGQGSPLGPLSDLEVLLNGAVWRFTIAAVVVCVVCAVLGWVRRESWQDIVLSISTLFFAALPEHLPVVLVAALGMGSKPLQRQEIFAQGLRTMESLGCVDTVMVDKAGTITESRLSLSSAIVASTPVGPDDLMEATREVPKSGPLAAEGGLEALGQLLEAWLFMSDMGDDLLQDAGTAAAKRLPASAPAAAAVAAPAAAAEEKSAGAGASEGGKEAAKEEEEEEHEKKMKEEKKEADAAQAQVDSEWRTTETGQSESLLLGVGGAGGLDSDMTARGGVIDPIDAAMLSAVGGPAVFTQLPYEGMDGADAAPTRGLRPLHDMLKRLYEAKLAAPLVQETLFDTISRGSTRTFRNVRATSLPTSAPSRAKSVQEKLKALGKRVAGQNGTGASPQSSPIKGPTAAPGSPLGPAGAAGGAAEEAPARTRMFVRGAPELLVEQCSRIMQGGEEVPIAPLRAQLQEHIQGLAAEGLVVIGYASGDIPQREGQEEATVGSVHSCTFLGVLALMNPVLPGVKSTVMQCRQAGVRVLLVTGDHPATALCAAKGAGICHPYQAQKVEVQQDAVSCLEKPPAHSTGEELGELLQGCSVFSRATPTDRLFIAEALRAGQSNCVAVCGTGGVDAPVLAAADIGVALGREAADVCRDSAGLVMLERSLPLIALSLSEGRRVMENARKAIGVSLGAKTALLLIFLVGTAWARFPFSPMQLAVLAVSLNAGVTFAYVHEPIDSDVFSRSPRRPGLAFFDLPMLLRVAMVAASISINVLLVFALALHALGAQVQSASMAFISCLLSLSLVAMNFRTSLEPVFHKGLFSNMWVLLWVLASIGWCAAISQPWALHRALRLEAMGTQLWVVIVGICIGGAFWTEIFKGIVWFYRQRGYEIPEWDEDAAVAALAGDVQMTPAAEVGEAPLLPAGGQQSDIEAAN